MTAAYDNYDYPKYWNSRSYEHDAEVMTINHFLRIMRKVDSIADVGCGHGRMCGIYAQKIKDITLIEPSKKLLALARKQCVSLNNKSQSALNVSYVRSTLAEVKQKLPKKKFDAIVLIRVLHHIEEPDKAFAQVNEMLTQKGYFILEFANKVHGKALLKQFLKGDFTFLLDIFPNDRRSRKNKKNKSIAFLNHHPDQILECLKKNGFKVIEKKSVSNIRSVRLKKYLPAKLLMPIEKFAQNFLSPFNFGPSIFILAQKK